LLTCFFCAAALPEASLDDLAGQVVALKGKPYLLVCFYFPLSEPTGFFLLTPFIPDSS
jgi:hypothetical protein